MDSKLYNEIGRAVEEAKKKGGSLTEQNLLYVVKVAQDIASQAGLSNVTFQHGDVLEVKGKFDFVVSRAVMPLRDMEKLVKRFISKENFNAIPNGLLCLKGGDLTDELSHYKNKVLVDDIGNYFKEEFFKTKKIIYLPI